MNKKICVLTLFFILLDQLSKIFISTILKVGQSITIIPNFFNITYVKNIGAAFSILEGNRYFFIIVAILSLIIIYYYFIKDKKLSNLEILLYSLLIGGIIGNVIDRVIYGYVIDFLSFTFFSFEFAIFNLADSFIVISILLLFYKEVNICKK